MSPRGELKLHKRGDIVATNLSFWDIIHANVHTECYILPCRICHIKYMRQEYMTDGTGMTDETAVIYFT